MKEIATLLFRAVMVAVSCFATWMSLRHARAEFIAGSLAPSGLEHALRVEPEDVELIVAEALRRADADDPSPTLNEALLRAQRMDPFNSQLLVAMGLRAEFRGDIAQAGDYLAKATEVDHSFRPAWTRASFCVRNGQLEKFWPMAQRCLSLDPLGFDPRPVFDLAWRVSDDAKTIRSILPKTGPRIIDYLRYLIDTNRTDAAADLWPDALDAFDPAQPGQSDVLLSYCDFLARNNRMSGSARAWNALVDRKIIRSGHLDPANGVSIADPDFSFAPTKGLFGWQATGTEGVFVTSGTAALRLEMDGNEPEALTLLSTNGVVVPRRGYRLRWKYDASQLSSPRDPGFDIRILQRPAGALTECAPFLHATDLNSAAEGACTFISGPDVERVGIELRYARASGTTRVQGTLVISNVHLEFAQ